MKYIIYIDPKTQEEEVKIFSSNIQHDTEARTFGLAYPSFEIEFASAGYFMILDNIIFAIGESLTMGLKSRPEDGEIIKKRLTV